MSVRLYTISWWWDISCTTVGQAVWKSVTRICLLHRKQFVCSLPHWFQYHTWWLQGHVQDRSVYTYYSLVQHADIRSVYTYYSLVQHADIRSVYTYSEVPTLPFWAEDLPLYVISPVLPFDRKISRWRKLKIFRSFYRFPNCPAIAFFIENSTERERKRAWVKQCCNIYF